MHTKLICGSPSPFPSVNFAKATGGGRWTKKELQKKKKSALGHSLDGPKKRAQSSSNYKKTECGYNFIMFLVGYCMK